jgi:hypothetical protein
MGSLEEQDMEIEGGGTPRDPHLPNVVERRGSSRDHVKGCLRGLVQG